MAKADLPPASNLAVEEFRRLQLGGGAVRRLYDLVIGRLRYECKRWTFAPPPSGVSQWWAMHKASRQWLRDLADISLNEGGTNQVVERLRWAFPRGLSLQQQQAIRDHLVKVLSDPEWEPLLRKYLANAEDPTLLGRLRQAVTPQTIADIIKFY